MSEDPAKRHINSIIAEWVVKIALIFFMASLFFSSTARKFAAEYGMSSGIMVYLKLGVIVVYGIIISVLERGMFKIIAFSTIIVGAMYKIVLTMSMDKFMLIDLIDLADEFLLIAVSIYYLYRHHRHEKKAKKKKKPSPKP
jgi:hypothetical protein